MKQISDTIIKRENAPFYIPLSAEDESGMLKTVGANSLDDLYAHIDASVKLVRDVSAPTRAPLSSDAVRAEITASAAKNKKFQASFLGDALPVWKAESIVDEISAMRGLSTAYTPYQPERSQGTLETHWIYQCAMSALTGFEAVNSSLYDRASAIFEAAAAACRITKKTAVVLSASLFACDIEVVKTFAANTRMKILIAPANHIDGACDTEVLLKILQSAPNIACAVFPQVSNVGTLENVDALANICEHQSVKSVAVVDPFLLGDGGLKPPSKFGAFGADIVVGEVQHLCSAPSFGGPGLGLFAMRYNEKNKNDIRQAAGRFVGRAKDISGRDAFVMVMSAREQHIRREKATSNICSNQAFMATLAGAALLQKGDEGMRESLNHARATAVYAFEKIMEIPGFEYPFDSAQFFNEFTVECPAPVELILRDAAKAGIQAGADASWEEAGRGNLLKLSLSDIHTREDVDLLCDFLGNFADKDAANSASRSIKSAPPIASHLLREAPPNLRRYDAVILAAHYRRLAEQNVSPDDSCYPLGSCTMKYNPLLNDELAALEAFQNCHPQSAPEDAQGCLEIMWNFADFIKRVTNMDDLALQPLSGAQGELCALKMFQAWHIDNSTGKRDVVLIPSSAHGTNFATAATAGYENIVQLPALSNGRLDLSALRAKLDEYGDRVAAIMITNPNTSGIFECDFKKIADMVHAAGGLVYMDGANFNAIAGRIDIKAMGVDAMHNNIHKTWSIAHGGGGPGDGFVAVNAKLADYIPSYCVVKNGGEYLLHRPKKSIGSLHRHFGNFAHKIRALAYALKMGDEGVLKMSGTAVLASRYLLERLRARWETLPTGAENEPRMHEFIITLPQRCFERLESVGVSKQQAVARTGKLFLDFGFHAPTVSFPEVFGLMIEPTESYDKAELDRFADAVLAIEGLIENSPQVAKTTPHFTPIDRVDETEANRNLVFSENPIILPQPLPNRIAPGKLAQMSIAEIVERIVSAGIF